MSLPSDQLARALELRDLSDPAAGPHAVQEIVATIASALAPELDTIITSAAHNRMRAPLPAANLEHTARSEVVGALRSRTGTDAGNEGFGEH